ncbi:DUF2919 domain-containing protein [Shewanella youngdeokensis]|uniref:DUF2919 domain-containing protein n=1 Tax=Shewanella youngdeokensis TaxID=2999068 RepID=A0ABZ0JUD2_9GAMM|nr:DUF2919 domain-containing protein [Shewanella sp. DAU334]
MNFSNITWLDDNGHMKPPLMLYLILVFIARGWCVLVASLTQASDRAGLVALVYPQKADFLMALMAGFGALVVYAMIIAERKRSPVWVQPMFRYARWLLLALLCIDAGLLIQRVVHSHYVYSWTVGLDALILFWSSLYWFKSKRLTHYFADWQSHDPAN